MTVAELKETIKDLPDDMELILQNADGNDCSPVAGVDSNCVYYPVNSWKGGVCQYNSASFLHSESSKVLLIYPIR